MFRQEEAQPRGSVRRSRASGGEKAPRQTTCLYDTLAPPAGRFPRF